MVVMPRSGINIEVGSGLAVYTSAADTSKASLYSSCSCRSETSTSGWSSASTFAKFYNQPVDVDNGFAENVLKSVHYETIVTYSADK